jgi:syntaxin 1B/2/3
MHQHNPDCCTTVHWQATINQVNTVAHQIKAKIEALDKSNEQALKRKGCGEGTASERTRTSITAGLKKKLKDQMGEFTNLRVRIQDEYREVVERRVFTVTGQRVPEEEIDKLIESGEAENIFQKAMLEQGRGRVLETLAEIQERHRAVKDLEQSLLELHQIFLDMAVLVEAQGEMLDNIEKQVERSVEYVQSGTVALQDAKQFQKKKRKWMCCALILLLIIALIIVIVVVKPWTLAK